MANHISNRDDVILKALVEELAGPAPRGQEIDLSVEIGYENPTDAIGPWKEKDTGEEILTRDRPTKRYGVAVLYPYGTGTDDTSVDSESPASPLDDPDESLDQVKAVSAGVTDEVAEELKKIAERQGKDFPEADDFELSNANTYRPSSLGVTFLAELKEGSEIAIEAGGGRYEKKAVKVGGRERFWWVRRPVQFNAKWTAKEICGQGAVLLKAASPAHDYLRLQIEMYSRPFGDIGQRMITVSLINREPAISRGLDEKCLFQAGFNIRGLPDIKNAKILPYPEATGRELDKEEKSIQLLYREALTFAVGHGCGADWVSAPGGMFAHQIKAECLPAFETPTITPDVRREDGTVLEVSMESLAGLTKGDDGFPALEEVITLYSAWIEKMKTEATVLSSEYRAIAERHLVECSRCAARMQSGLNFLKSDKIALAAFRLANHAILLQQIRTRREPREIQFNPSGKHWVFSEPYPPIQYARKDKGKWRAFQIAFLLMSVRSAVDGNAEDRETVELIWFPTGGGKTEAYLGLAAFSAFMRRLRNPSDSGVHVLMRYTLRLLTAQQFQRASTLICAMEYLRRKSPMQLGESPFSIGIWLGSATTPNTRQDALQTLRSLQRGERNASNKFILSRCPWCGAQMGPVKYTVKLPGAAPKCPGYERSGHTVIFKCTDAACDFSNSLPVCVIDEDIYEQCPTLIIGTVDKFAMLAWVPAARSMFGLSQDGKRICSPPGLIIQDELHLISGPLGSMVGLYEGVIGELCTDHRSDTPVIPKLISSTATIRRYSDQVRCLYGRVDVALFPPPGLKAGDSFFARYERTADGSLTHGRKYVGIYAAGLGSMQTVQVRTFSALLQAPMTILSKAERDPWWTLLTFFNSLRELGTTLSLFQSDIPDYQNVQRHRLGLKPADIRRLRIPMELTGRLRGDEVQEAIDVLDISTESTGGRPVDVCLASNIIEVGIDIDRLSLICVVGQPKTTSQYIQVTGRIGRQSDRPGLVVVIYGVSKPRDRSHFEKFRSYHERLYANVEPTSVTPFSPPALDRALHAVMAVFARQAGPSELATNPHPYPKAMMLQLKNMLLMRAHIVDKDEVGNFLKTFELRENQWRRWQRVRWQGNPTVENTPLLREAGSYVPPAVAAVSWPTPLSMRNVDAECEIEITQNYLHDITDGGPENV